MVLRFITTGGESLTAYDEYRKVDVEDGIYKVNNRRWRCVTAYR